MLRPEVIHIQYPTGPLGASLVPQALTIIARKVPVVVTLHEFRHTHLLRRVSCLPFALHSRTIVFTTEYERQQFSVWYPWAKRKSATIPIGSNIPFSREEVDRDPLGVYYFGLLRPEKGLKEFVELVKLAREKNRPYRFAIIGAFVPKYASYYERLKKRTDGLPITWHLDLPMEQAAACLASLRFAYLPFPDGASERRASLLAALGNGAVVITKQGSQTTNKLRGVVRFVSDPSKALSLLDHLVLDSEQVHSLSLQGREYASQFSWRSIAQAHRRLYEQVRGTTSPSSTVQF
jgi:glycosyltransferase involved in cell wall biosynthesis